MKLHKSEAIQKMREFKQDLSKYDMFMCSGCKEECELAVVDYSFTHAFGNESDYRVQSKCCEVEFEIKERL
jgi:hypothetical protein